ncbi:hypothetical protein HMPREF1043_1204 [Streptococcus anginosus subsp. whileyi CCUG 39159]|uniref:Uncharacterized protein n=2 Tax=Streptococcus anginosus group TaxID=671232 RepID=I0SHX1_STRAP|nr:hypothetical protein HMPREF1044_1590 [Streptococcus constellatus subsp. constellatus SK53]EID22974.1 hypothetical protein HMPREF1043_1204 [Streptococcus anginosus subsp. whileyi CCUG 39159]BBD22716.1 hypothetical protein SCSC_1043 [Streptococcus constellatus subsp. constellatus]
MARSDNILVFFDDILQENQSGQDFNLSIYEKEGIYGN